jgi:16S rRNA (cytidine1402-2'-O)-methyltransferase
LVFYESGPRLAASLSDLADGLGARAAAVCRELTKLHEEVRRGDLATLAHDYAQVGAETRGEIVIVVAPPADDEGAASDVDELLRNALARVSVKEAVGEVALATGRPRREVYQRALDHRKEASGGE